MSDEIQKNIQIGQFVNSQDYRVLKDRLMEKILNLDSLSVLFDKMKDVTLEQFGKEAYMNAKAIKVIVEWLSEAEGDASMLETNLSELREKKEEKFIERIKD